MTKITQTASHWGVFQVETSEGKILRTVPFAGDARPARYVGSLPETVHHELRIDRPYVRQSYLRHRESAPRNRGGEAFVPVSWDVALDLVETELRRVKDRYGNQAIYGGSYGWASAGRFHHSPSVLKRFLGLYGGYVDKAGNHSFGAAMHMMPYIIGDGDVPSHAVPWSEILGHTKLVVMFGGGSLKNTQYNGKVLQFSDIKMIYSVGGNPFHHNANLNRFLEAWQKPHTVIVHEPWWTPPARFADIVLPATTTMERNDILASEHNRFYIAMHKVIEPVGQSRNDFDVFAELSARLGMHDAYTCGRNEMGWLRHMYDGARETALQRGYSPPPFDEFWAAGSYEFPKPERDETFLGAFREDPTVNKLGTESGKIETSSARIKSFNYDCPFHASWLEPAEWLGGRKVDRFPIHLLSHQPTARLHSQLDMSSVGRASKVHGRETLRISCEDAESRGLTEGDLVRVFNDRGAFIAAVRIVDGLRQGVAQIATGAWYDPQEPGRVGTVE